MSTYYTPKSNIKIIDVLEISNKIQNFTVERQIQHFDNLEFNKRRDKIKKEGGSFEKLFDSQYSFERITYNDLKFNRFQILPNSTFRINYEGQYCFVYTDDMLENCTFVRYGGNDVETIISIIQYQTSIVIFDEHTEQILDDVFGVYDDEVVVNE